MVSTSCADSYPQTKRAELVQSGVKQATFAKGWGLSPSSKVLKEILFSPLLGELEEVLQGPYLGGWG